MTKGEMRWIWEPSTGITDIRCQPSSLSASEIPGIRAVWEDQRTRLKGTRQLADFTERLSREWAIETGIIENLYEIERGVTQTLIERGFQAELLSQGTTNRPRDYVIRILRDQKDALDGVFDFVAQRRTLSLSYIKELHAALLRSQETTEGVDAFGQLKDVPLLKGEWKIHPNYPSRDGIVYGYCPPEQVASEMERLISVHMSHVDSGVAAEVQAAWLHHRFTQIHPFQDGNGRVARAITSLILVKEGLFPLVVTRDDKPSYLDALEDADRGDLKPLVGLIAKLQRLQFTRATAISETLLSEGADVEAILGGLMKAAEKMAADKQFNLERVFEVADDLQSDLVVRLNTVAGDVRSALLKVCSSASCHVVASDPATEHYYRAQIIENARSHLHYFADLSEFRKWVALSMAWDRRAHLVFALHSIGRPFTGSLVCAPFLEFRDRDEGGQLRPTLIPVADEGFVFFHDETSERVLARFQHWREAVLKVALKELIRNL